MLRGIRGATTVERNGQIAEQMRELLRLLVERNGVRV
jgi:chorismate mutase